MATTGELTPRGTWGGKFEFLLTCVGYSVGLGNIWRFPYLCYMNGGGTFLLQYVIMTVAVGIPMLYIELAVAQFSSLGPISVWSMAPIFKGIGIAMVLTSWMISLYYIVILAWAFYFLFASFTTLLPWSKCGNHWNTHLCVTSADLKTLVANSTLQNLTFTERNISNMEELKAPSEEYFYNKVLQMSEGLEDIGSPSFDLALCLFLAWFVVFLVLIRGMQSLGKVGYFFTIFPYLMLTALLARGATLEGASNGVLFYLTPQAEKLADTKVWAEAAAMVFYSLGTSMGVIIAMASHNTFKHNFYSDSLVVSVISGLTSLYCGFVIFSELGFMAHIKGVSIDKVLAQGPGLVFVVYPEALSQMPVPPVWSVLFFLMLLTLGYGTQFAFVETPFVAIMDAFPHIFRINKTRPIILRAVCISIYYLISLPMVTNSGYYLFSLTDAFVGGFPVLLIAILEFFAICCVYGYKRLSEDVNLMLGKPPPILFKLCCMTVTPLSLLFCVVVKCALYEPYRLEDYVYPTWGQALGWLQVGFIYIWIPIWAFIIVIREGKVWKTLREISSPEKPWGPATAEDRVGTQYDQNTVMTKHQTTQI